MDEESEEEVDSELVMVVTDTIAEPTSESANSAIVDSGCTSHMFRDTTGFTNARQTKRTIHFGSSSGPASTARTVGQTGIVKDVLHVPDLRHDLVSVGKLDADGKWTIFEGR